MEGLERFLNSPLAVVCIGCLCIEWGISRVRKQPFSLAEFFSVFLIAYGIRIILR